MEWHWPDASSIISHLPHSLGDLLHHEDKELVRSGAAGLRVKPPTEGSGHRLILPDAVHGAAAGSKPSSKVAIEKDMDAAVSRSELNMGLLIRDYLKNLPEYTSESQQGEALLRHWRKILRQQPRRLAEAHLESWNDERLKAFWKERLSHFLTDYTLDADLFPHPNDDWERSAGGTPPPPKILGIMKTKQWQDLVIRQRLHHLDLHNMSR